MPLRPAPDWLPRVVIASDRFEETKGVIGGIAYLANEYGSVIYEVASGSARSRAGVAR